MYTKLNKKTTLNSIKPQNLACSDLLSSETKGFRLLQIITTYRDANGVTKKGRVKLDTWVSRTPTIIVVPTVAPMGATYNTGNRGNPNPIGEPNILHTL